MKSLLGEILYLLSHFKHTMNLLNTLQIGLRLYLATILQHLMASAVIFVVISVLYWWLAPVIFEMPIEEIALLSQDSKKIEALLSNPAFGVKSWLFMLLLDGIITPFGAGLYHNYNAVTKGETATFGNVFTYYHSAYTGSIISYLFYLMAFKTIIAVVLGGLGFPALSMATLVVISLVFSFTIPIIIFEDKSVLKAMGESYKCIVPSIFTVMLALSLAFIVSLSGLFVFGIGIVVTLPILSATIFALYYQARNKK